MTAAMRRRASVSLRPKRSAFVIMFAGSWRRPLNDEQSAQVEAARE
jgi:hypothetical protein